MTQRRYDIDWLRVIAIGLLIIYHAAIAFQPWGGIIGFIQNNETIDWIWYPMSMLNMWRIPILFFVSGMGVYFSMQKRNLFQLFKERTLRILIPFIFGVLVIVPIHILIWQKYYYQDLKYTMDQSHLWFLLNIIVYTIIIAPIAFLGKKIAFINVIRLKSTQPIIFLLTAVLFIAESEIIKPLLFTLYAYNLHGWIMGFISFTMGFYMMSLDSKFWLEFKKWKWVYLTIASSLFTIRLIAFNLESPYYLMSIESASWVFTVFGFFYQYTNHSSKSLRYLSKAAYPIYIIHMIVQFSISSVIFPLNIPANIKMLVLMFGGLSISMFIYHFIIRNLAWFRPLFGLKYKSAELTIESNQTSGSIIN